jgi:hypothetical protein
MTEITTYLNVTGLNSPFKRHRLADLFKKHTQPFVAYKKYTLLAKTNIGLK